MLWHWCHFVLYSLWQPGRTIIGFKFSLPSLSCSALLPILENFPKKDSEAFSALKKGREPLMIEFESENRWRRREIERNGAEVYCMDLKSSLLSSFVSEKVEDDHKPGGEFDWNFITTIWAMSKGHANYNIP